MKPIGCVWIPVLACVDMLSYGEANAQGRGPDVRELRTEAHARAAVEAEKATDPAMRAARLGELEVWLKRVVGRFSVEGTTRLLWATTWTNVPESGCAGGFCYVTQNVQGIGDCSRVGAGPGLHCIINVPWPRFFQPSSMGASEAQFHGEMKWPGPYLDGAVLLLGIDPDSLGFRFQLVDGQSIAYTELGFLKDDTATFETRCPQGQHGEICRRALRISAKADGRVEMRYELSYNGFLNAEIQLVRKRAGSSSEEFVDLPSTDQ